MTPPTHEPVGDRAKVLSVRLSWDEFEALQSEAERIGVGASTLARTLVRKGLAMSTPTNAPRAAVDIVDPARDVTVELEQRVSALEQLMAQHLATSTRG